MNLREIDRLIGERVMGWKPVIGGMQPKWSTVPAYWERPGFRAELSMAFFRPTKDSDAARLVRARLVELGFIWHVMSPMKRVPLFGCTIDRLSDETNVAVTTGDTEEIAICLAALKSVGCSIDELITPPGGCER